MMKMRRLSPQKSVRISRASRIGNQQVQPEDPQNLCVLNPSLGMSQIFGEYS